MLLNADRGSTKRVPGKLVPLKSDLTKILFENLFGGYEQEAFTANHYTTDCIIDRDSVGANDIKQSHSMRKSFSRTMPVSKF